MKIGIVCSPGGHLTQALSVTEAFSGHDFFLVIQDFPVVRKIQLEGIQKIYRLRIFLGYSWRLGVILSLIWNSFSLLRILWKERPQILFSTGAEIVIPAFYLAKFFFKTKLIFLESVTRISSPSRAGKWVYPITDLFLVQEPSLVSSYGSKAVYAGSVL